MIRYVTMGLLLLTLQTTARANGSIWGKVGPALRCMYMFYFDPLPSEDHEDNVCEFRPRLGEPGRYVHVQRQRGRFANVRLSAAPISMEDGIPYVDDFIAYNGFGNDLNSLGVTILDNYYPDTLRRSSAMVLFPLAILEQVVSLPNVGAISDAAPIHFNADLNLNAAGRPENPTYGNLEVCFRSEDTALEGAVRLMSQALDFPPCRISPVLAVGGGQAPPQFAVDSLPVGEYHLLFYPSDSSVWRYAVNGIDVFPDSCTRVEIEIAGNREAHYGTVFSPWQRENSDVVAIGRNNEDASRDQEDPGDID